MDFKVGLVIILFAFWGCTSPSDRQQNELQLLIQKRDVIAMQLDSSKKRALHFDELWNKLYWHLIDSVMMAHQGSEPEFRVVDSLITHSGKSIENQWDYYTNQSVVLSDSLKKMNKEIGSFKLSMRK